MADDPFADLDDGRPKRSAAERFEEEDRVNPEADDPRRRRPEIRRPANRYAWVVGIVMLMGIGVLLLTTAIPNSGAGLEGPTPGRLLPEFAAPAAYGNLDGDANVCHEGGKCGKGAGSVPACRVRSDQVVNSCLLRKKPVVLTFLVTRGADCEPQVDRVERMRKQFPQVNFAAVVSGNDRGDVERIARRRGWTMPVAVDSDGAVVNLFGVGVCPTTVFARKGGRVRTTKLGNLTEGELRAQVRAVLAKR
jgi:peroxiredoxin